MIEGPCKTCNNHSYIYSDAPKRTRWCEARKRRILKRTRYKSCKYYEPRRA